MKIGHHDENRLSVQTETFQMGAEVLRSNPLANFTVIAFSIVVMLLSIPPNMSFTFSVINHQQFFGNPIGKGLLALLLGVSGLAIFTLATKLPPPKRIPKVKYIFDRETDMILAESKTQKIHDNLSQVKNIQLIFDVETDEDYETGIVTRTDSRYSIEIDFENGISLQMERNSCSLIKSDNDKSVFCNLVSDSDAAVKKLQEFLNLGIDGDEMS